MDMLTYRQGLQKTLGKHSFFAAIVAILSTCFCSSSAFAQLSPWKLEKIEKQGVKFHQQRKYKKAYEKLIVSAKQGYKQSQYLLGYMYLKGQHVKTSLLTGFAWLGVASEANIKEWRDTFDTLYASLNDDQRRRVDANVAAFIQQYGLKSQKMHCESVKSSVRARNKPKIFCQKEILGDIGIYDL